ncbi:hypothetical protein Tco_0558156 [Tanacetum coccineum]
MVWLPKCTVLHERVGGWEWVNMMVLYCQWSAAEDRKFASQISALLREMIAAYDDKLDFIRELKVLPGVIAAVKTAELLMRRWDRDKCSTVKACGFFWAVYHGQRTQSIAALPRCDELRRAVSSLEWEDMFILYYRRAVSEDLRLAREINVLCAGLTAVIEEKENFVDELDVLVDRFVPEKMVEFMKESQDKDTPNLMKLHILGREFELRAHEKNLFIEKPKGNIEF